MKHISKQINPIQVTQRPGHHFFGYYDKEQWDMSNRYLLSNQVNFINRSPKGNDSITLGMIDTQNNYEFTPISTSKAWCWQQGTMFQWVPGHNHLIIHNDRIGDRFVSVLMDINTGTRRVLPRPTYTVSNDGKKVLSLNFSRTAVTRPGYGYNGLQDWRAHEDHSSEDGIYIQDLETGDHRLIIDVNRIVHTKHDERMDNAVHWFNHLLFNPTDERFIFLHRWSNKNKNAFYTRLCTADIDGGNLFISDILDGSHFIWYDNNHILIWARGYKGEAYYMIEDLTDDTQVFGEGILTRNGHCTVSSDKRWVLTDEYPDKKNMRPLILYNIQEGLRIDIGDFYSPPELGGELRCDLHPRWNRDDSFICIDSAHTGERQMYILDVREITRVAKD